MACGKSMSCGSGNVVTGLLATTVVAWFVLKLVVTAFTSSVTPVVLLVVLDPHNKSVELDICVAGYACSTNAAHLRRCVLPQNRCLV